MIRVYLPFLLFLALILGCSESSLTGANAGKNKSSDQNSSDDDDDDKKSNSNDLDEDGDDDDDGLDFGEGELDFCSSKSGKANIIYVIDNTSSMDESDVLQVRSGGSALLGEIDNLANDEKSPKFQVAIVGFGEGSSPMPNGWVDMEDNDALTRLNSDLNKAADPDNMGGDSIPDAGLQDAKKLFDQLPTSKDKEHHRNFVVLYTDYGIETDNNEQNLPVIAATLANDIGAAILVIGFGDIDGDDRAIWDGISLPKNGIVSPKHVGKHVTTGSASALTPLFKDVVNDLVADCK